MTVDKIDVMSRITHLQTLIPALESILSSFITSNRKFQRVATLDPGSPWPSLASATDADKTEQQQHVSQDISSRHASSTTIVLDASFNPPSKAHAALALTALARSSQSRSNYGGPARLLLLLGTRNADKHTSTPAAHTQRLAMLLLFATDIRDALLSNDTTTAATSTSIPIDIGLASMPYMADKAAAIALDPLYASPPTHSKDSAPAPGTPHRQIHVMGHDTIIRVLAPRYYASHTPPLSALAPLFGRGHRALVVLRPEDADDDAAAGSGGGAAAASGADAQRREVQALVGGRLEAQGFRREWAELVEVVESREAAGISSTNVRAAAAKHEYDVVRQMCTPSVAAWIEHQDLYDQSHGQSGKI